MPFALQISKCPSAILVLHWQRLKATSMKNLGSGNTLMKIQQCGLWLCSWHAVLLLKQRGCEALPLLRDWSGSRSHLKAAIMDPLKQARHIDDHYRLKRV
jgi:hypothetical protein